MDGRLTYEYGRPPLAPSPTPAPPRAFQRGMSLVELLVVIPMLMIVLLSIYALSNVGVKVQRQTSDRVSTMLRQQNGLERMTREMRQAVGFTPVSAQILDAETYVRPRRRGVRRFEARALRVPERVVRPLRGPVGRLTHQRARDRDPQRPERGRLLLRAEHREPELRRT